MQILFYFCQCTSNCVAYMSQSAWFLPLIYHIFHKFCYIFASILPTRLYMPDSVVFLLTKFIADTLQNLFLPNLTVWIHNIGPHAFRCFNNKMIIFIDTFCTLNLNFPSTLAYHFTFLEEIKYNSSKTSVLIIFNYIYDLCLKLAYHLVKTHKLLKVLNLFLIVLEFMII